MAQLEPLPIFSPSTRQVDTFPSETRRRFSGYYGHRDWSGCRRTWPGRGYLLNSLLSPGPAWSTSPSSPPYSSLMVIPSIPISAHLVKKIRRKPVVLVNLLLQRPPFFDSPHAVISSIIPCSFDSWKSHRFSLLTILPTSLMSTQISLTGFMAIFVLIYPIIRSLVLQHASL